MHVRPIPASRPADTRSADTRLQRLVVGQLECLVEDGRVVARVVHGPGGSPVGHRLGRNQVAARKLGWIEAESSGRDRHRPFQSEVELRPAEPPVETGRAACS